MVFIDTCLKSQETVLLMAWLLPLLAKIDNASTSHTGIAYREEGKVLAPPLVAERGVRGVSSS